MLDEGEWEMMEPLLRFSSIQRIRGEKGLGLGAAWKDQQAQACAMYEKLTGYKETVANAIWHHRLALFGPECPDCGQLLRTPQARFCANCGYRPEARTPEL